MENNKWFDKARKDLREMNSPVDAKTWTEISSQITATTGFFGSMSSAVKAIAIGSVLTTVAVVAFVNINGISSEQKVKVTEISKPEVSNELSTEAKGAKDINQTVFKNDQIKELSKSESLDREVGQVKDPEPFVKQINEGIQTERDIRLIKVDKEPIIVGQEVKSVSSKLENTQYVDVLKSKSASEAVSLGIMPNVFTPNNDGSNDLFFVDIIGLEEFSLVVLNGKNEVVWKTLNPKDQWTGVNANGDKVRSGEYTYFVSGKDAFGEYHVKYQTLSIKY